METGRRNGGARAWVSERACWGKEERPMDQKAVCSGVGMEKERAEIEKWWEINHERYEKERQLVSLSVSSPLPQSFFSHSFFLRYFQAIYYLFLSFLNPNFFFLHHFLCLSLCLRLRLSFSLCIFVCFNSIWAHDYLCKRMWTPVNSHSARN